MSSTPLHDPLAPPLAGATTETRTTTCYMCACRCGIRVHLRDGEIRYIDGNPDHPLNAGVICAKGSSGIMKQYSPARLTKPLVRRPGAERGAGDFVETTWDEAFAILEKRLRGIRATDPKRFALFTGRDQMQALTGLFARQFGTPNYAAHGGFCSVNMAAGMIYTIGGSFWEFGGPDLDRAKLFVMIGTAEDHHSNPLKIAISKFKRDGGRFISINPIRTGYSAIADDWLPIKPGTDGALLLALIHELIALGLYDREFLVRYTNAGQLVNLNEANDGFGMFVRTEVPEDEGCFDPQNKLWWDRTTNRPVVTHSQDADPFLLGEFRLSDGTVVKPAFQLLKERVEDYTPDWAAGITGIPAEAIRRLAHEMGITARDQKIELPDTTYLERHDVMSMLDRPISEFEGPIDSVRIPVVPPTRDCKPFQEVLIELAGRLKFPAFVRTDGTRKFRDYPDFIVNFETEPGSGIGFLAGWRGKGGEKFMRGSFNTREFMHGKSNAVLRSVKWVFPAAAFALPLRLLAATLAGAPAGLLTLAFVVQYVGLLAERWFFFAQANHPQNIYYQAVA